MNDCEKTGHAVSRAWRGSPQGYEPLVHVRRHPLKILVAEDNVVNQMVVRAMLERRGHRVVVAADGAEAVILWEQGGFDLILMDIQMPEMDGVEATRVIRAEETRRGLTHTPIVAVTAYGASRSRDGCLDAGMDAYLTKPVSLDVLADAVESYAGRS